MPGRRHKYAEYENLLETLSLDSRAGRRAGKASEQASRQASRQAATSSSYKEKAGSVCLVAPPSLPLPLPPAYVGNRRNALRFDYAKLLQVLRHVWSCWLNAYKCGLILSGSTHRDRQSVYVCMCACACASAAGHRLMQYILRRGEMGNICLLMPPEFACIWLGFRWLLRLRNACGKCQAALASTAFVTANFSPSYVCICVPGCVCVCACSCWAKRRISWPVPSTK